MSEPEWLKVAAADSLISSREFAELLGISTKTLLYRVSKGCIPQPDARRKQQSRLATLHWRASTVRACLKGHATSVSVGEIIQRYQPWPRNMGTAKCYLCNALLHDVPMHTKYCEACSLVSKANRRTKCIKGVGRGRKHGSVVGPSRRKFGVPR